MTRTRWMAAVSASISLAFLFSAWRDPSRRMLSVFIAVVFGALAPGWVRSR